MRVNLNWHEAVHFSARADSGHEIEIDGPPDLGGTNVGTRPMGTHAAEYCGLRCDRRSTHSDERSSQSETLQCNSGCDKS